MKEDGADINRLGAESSPYLKQHAHNPVAWWPWCEEAFEAARASDRPILLSIGYSACHWCHVMERESFDDPETARLMNTRFINIKVDREERPDVDHVYMTAIQALTGQGGWPLTAFLRPDRVPFFGGTYFPPEARHGMPAFRTVLRAAADAYHQQRDRVDDTATRILEVVQAVSERGRGADLNSGPDTPALEGAVQALLRAFDPVHGGFGQAPKFPQPSVIRFLLQRAARTGDPATLHAGVHTLRRMAAGGIQDHLGGGFHRYSVDARWLVPHFEKMLYDQAQLVPAYLEASALTGDVSLASVAEDVLAYVASDLTDPQGGFYSARDADSEGEEGLFYVWTSEEVNKVLGEDADVFRRVYDVSTAGNFERRNILHRPHDLEAIARAENTSVDGLEARLSACRTRLLDARAEREPPFRDEKVLTDWNALMIRAFAHGGRFLGRQDLVDRATRAAEFLLSIAGEDGLPPHTWMDGAGSGTVTLSDVAGLGNALLDLHEVTRAGRWLDAAERLGDAMVRRYWDEGSKLLYDTPHDAEALIVRPRDLHDGALPSGQALAAELLERLGRIYERAELTAIATAILAGLGEPTASPLAFGASLRVADRMANAPLDIVIRGSGSEVNALTDVLARRVLPGLVVLHLDPDALPETPVPALVSRSEGSPSPAAWVCWHHSCSAPTSDPRQLAALLEAPSRSE